MEGWSLQGAPKRKKGITPPKSRRPEIKGPMEAKGPNEEREGKFSFSSPTKWFY